MEDFRRNPDAGIPLDEIAQPRDFEPRETRYLNPRTSYGKGFPCMRAN